MDDQDEEDASNFAGAIEIKEKGTEWLLNNL